MRLYWVVGVCSALVLSGCATEYNPEMGLTGGSEVSMVTPTRAVVSFRSNGYTSSDRVQQYVMLRAAELTIQKGFGHFAILNTTDDSTQNTVYTGFWTATEINFPKERVEIEMFPGGKPMGSGPNVFNAADIINTVRPTLASDGDQPPPPSVAAPVLMEPVPISATSPNVAAMPPSTTTALIAATVPGQAFALPPVPTQTEKLPGHRVAGYGCPGFAPRILYAESPDMLPKACERMEPL